MTELKTILLAEDNNNDAELTIEALNANKLANKVIHVTDGVEALDYLHCKGKFADWRSGNPAVILLDIKMPRMDGIEVLEQLKRDEKFKLIPVVMLTSSREEPDLKRCYNLGVNAYVVKPVNFSSFIDSVKNIGVFWILVNETL
jgi:two-component system response regulator